MNDTDPKPARKPRGAAKKAAPSSPGAGAVPPAPAAQPRGPGRPTTSQKLTEKLTGTIAMPGMFLYAIGSTQNNELLQADGQAILNGAPGLAEALVKLAEDEPKVMKAIVGVQSASAYGAVFSAVAAIAFPILVNHGIVPAGIATAAPEPAAA